MPEKEKTRKALAEFLRVTPEEIIITRNTSESNNLVSNGLDLKAGDEVIVHADNHPSNLNAWREKAKRFGFTVVTVEQKNPHPGMDYYVDAYTRAMTPRTKIITFTHLSSTVGDLMPAKELCQLARERGVLSLLDGAQSFGLLDVDLADIQPDFYTGSAHKWPCGARECGVLFVNKSAQDKLWPSIYSAYPGAVGFSKTFEGFGQRDEATMIALREALAFQTKVGRAAIEQRARALSTQLMTGLAKLPGVTVWTSPDAGAPRGGRLVPAGNARRQQAGGGALREGSDCDHHARRPGPSRPARLAALLQQPRGGGSAARRARQVSEDRRLDGVWHDRRQNAADSAEPGGVWHDRPQNAADSASAHASRDSAGAGRQARVRPGPTSARVRNSHCGALSMVTKRSNTSPHFRSTCCDAWLSGLVTATSVERRSTSKPKRRQACVISVASPRPQYGS